MARRTEVNGRFPGFLGDVIGHLLVGHCGVGQQGVDAGQVNPGEAADTPLLPPPKRFRSKSHALGVAASSARQNVTLLRN